MSDVFPADETPIISPLGSYLRAYHEAIFISGSTNMLFSALTSVFFFAGAVRGGTTIWSGSFNAYPTVATFDNCEYRLRFTGTMTDPFIGSWSSEVGEYQWVSLTVSPQSYHFTNYFCPKYIHGSQPTSHYLALSPSYKNPADTSETNGIKMTIDSTATWSGQTMERSEVDPYCTPWTT